MGLKNRRSGVDPIEEADEIRRLERLCERLAEERDRLTAQVANQKSTIQRQSVCVTQLETDLAAIRSSNSWRVTRPFRVGARLLIGTLRPAEAVRLARKELSELMHRTYARRLAGKTSFNRGDLDEVLFELKSALGELRARAKKD